MELCFLVGDLGRSGGTERMTAWASAALSADHHVHILSLQMSGGKEFFPFSPAVDRAVVPFFPGKLSAFRQIGWIRHYLKEHKIQCIINVDIGMGFYGILAAKGTGAKVITWEHGNFYNNWGSRLFPHLRRYAAKHSDTLVVLTQKDKKNYEENIKGCAPVTVIGNPAQPHHAAYDVGSRTILSVGHLLENKGYHRVVEMAKKILPSRPDWNWVIWGEGPERARLETAIREAGLEERVSLPGSTKDIDAQYQKAAMLVLTSDMEGLPMTLLEGKSWGLPLIAFDIMTGPSDIITDGVNGYLVDPFDLESMSDRISKLMDDESMRLRMSADAVVGMDKFSEQSIIDTWEHLLKEI